MATKQELATQVAKLEATNVTLVGYGQELEQQIVRLQAEVASLRKELGSRPQGRSAPPSDGRFKTASEAQAWAKSEAVRTGKCVRVPAWG